MARANRHFISGHVWHLTHRCHKKEFLLKFGKDRHRWMQWLYESKKRYGLVILNYVVTSNHIHLIVHGKGASETIPKSLQLVAGRTAQEYNRRKKRKGAFWEDRYELWEPQPAYSAFFEVKKNDIDGENLLYWNK